MKYNPTLPRAKGLTRIARVIGRLAGTPLAKTLLRAGELMTSLGGTIVAAIMLLCRGDAPSPANIAGGFSFWLLLVVYLATQPICDFFAFRVLWPLSWSTLPAFFRKTAINELVLGYLGDLHLYGCAKRDPLLCGSAFGTVKDSAIVSAIVGNMFTVAMLVAALPWLGLLHLGSARLPLASSILIVLGSSFLVSLLRARVFASSSGALARMAMWHALRVVGMTMLLCLLWRSMIPGVTLSSLLLLGAGRQLLTRLPIAPNKDLIFAGLVTLLAAPGSSIGTGIVAVAALIAVAQALIGSALLLTTIAFRPILAAKTSTLLRTC